MVQRWNVIVDDPSPSDFSTRLNASLDFGAFKVDNVFADSDDCDVTKRARKIVVKVIAYCYKTATEIIVQKQNQP